MSTTAQRWWVRLAARWLARLEAVAPIIQMAMLGLTGISTGLMTLKQYGHSEYAWPLVAAIAAGTVVVTYFYTEGGVFNQKNRDKSDIGTNYAGPTMRIDDELIASGVFAAVHGRPPDDDEQEAIAKAVDRPWRQYRDGIHIKEN